MSLNILISKEITWLVKLTQFEYNLFDFRPLHLELIPSHSVSRNTCLWKVERWIVELKLINLFSSISWIFRTQGIVLNLRETEWRSAHFIPSHWSTRSSSARSGELRGSVTSVSSIRRVRETSSSVFSSSTKLSVSFNTYNGGE